MGKRDSRGKKVKRKKSKKTKKSKKDRGGSGRASSVRLIRIKRKFIAQKEPLESFSDSDADIGERRGTSRLAVSQLATNRPKRRRQVTTSQKDPVSSKSGKSEIRVISSDDDSGRKSVSFAGIPAKDSSDSDDIDPDGFSSDDLVLNGMPGHQNEITSKLVGDSGGSLDDSDGKMEELPPKTRKRDSAIAVANAKGYVRMEDVFRKDLASWEGRLTKILDGEMKVPDVETAVNSAISRIGILKGRIEELLRYAWTRSERYPNGSRSITTPPPGAIHPRARPWQRQGYIDPRVSPRPLPIDPRTRVNPLSMTINPRESIIQASIRPQTRLETTRSTRYADQVMTDARNDVQIDPWASDEPMHEPVEDSEDTLFLATHDRSGRNKSMSDDNSRYVHSKYKYRTCPASQVPSLLEKLERETLINEQPTSFDSGNRRSNQVIPIFSKMIPSNRGGWDDWYVDLQRWKRCYQISDDEAQRQIIANCLPKGSAELGLFANLYEMPYDRFKKFIFNQFGGESSIGTRIQKLNRFSYKMGEDPRDTWDRFLALLTRYAVVLRLAKWQGVKLELLQRPSEGRLTRLLIRALRGPTADECNRRDYRKLLQVRDCIEFWQNRLNEDRSMQIDSKMHCIKCKTNTHDTIDCRSKRKRPFPDKITKNENGNHKWRRTNSFRGRGRSNGRGFNRHFQTNRGYGRGRGAWRRDTKRQNRNKPGFSMQNGRPDTDPSMYFPTRGSSQMPKSIKDAASQSRSKKTIFCRNCHSQGHHASECRLNTMNCIIDGNEAIVMTAKGHENDPTRMIIVLDDGKKLPVTWDTGAGINAMNPKFAEKYGLKTIHSQNGKKIIGIGEKTVHYRVRLVATDLITSGNPLIRNNTHKKKTPVNVEF